jgi:hypothetical protein
LYDGSFDHERGQVLGLTHFLKGAFHSWSEIAVSCLVRHHQFLFKIRSVSVVALVSTRSRNVEGSIGIACHEALVGESEVDRLIVITTP